MTSDEIRSTFLDFFVARDHLRLPSAPLVPADYDPSVLLTTAGMHPLKPYFLGRETPPHNRLATCQKVFRTTDIENVGTTARHLTFFEMLGNFSVGDYFKPGAVEFAWELSREGFGLREQDIWVTVHRGDEALGLGPDEEAIEAWRAVGVPDERIVQLGSQDNFWQAGPSGPCGPCSELYLDRGPEFGGDDERPGDDTERYLEFWNLVFMQFNQDPPGTLTPLPSQNIDTGLGLNRMAAILQDVPSVYETDQFLPLVQLGEELSGRRMGQDERTTRALRVLADHSRGMTFLIADGVVPSNEDRGYILRRVMRRAVLQGRRIGLEPGFLPRFSQRVIEIMGGEYAELHEQREAIVRWVGAEEEAFGRTLETGTRLLDEIVARAREDGLEGIGADAAFQLHDTYGFPFDLTRELAAEAGLGVDESGFETLMERQRMRARSAVAMNEGDGSRERVRTFAESTGFATEFTGYATVEQTTTIGAVAPANGSGEESPGRVLAKLVESPFYAAGGGQISDVGVVECEDGGCRARVAEVFRIGEDQAVALEVEAGSLSEGSRVVARVDSRARHATEANHTATHLLHAALRERLGTHVRQAGSYVGPDKLRFDFTHGGALSAEELRAVEDRVNEWILSNQPVRALTTTLDEARALGAMALFGEKYGDVVRMVEVGEGSFSRELCGGTHVRSTAEIGVFHVMSETSNAANVRRIEAVTGPVAVELLRRHDAVLRQAAGVLRTQPERVVDAVEKLRETASAKASAPAPTVSVDDYASEEIEGVAAVIAEVPAGDEKALLKTMDQLKAKHPDAAILLAAPGDGKVSFVAAVPPSLVERGVKAGAIVKAAAEVTGGGGGGRDTMARAGGRDPSKTAEALTAARATIAAAVER
ncbi:MAG: alanyl-tRNA synthetase [Solirubrobacteraceae bacterium]|nr:alanyl-tRNA synthetase [Solirubrobacteraceae bacterium]